MPVPGLTDRIVVGALSRGFVVYDDGDVWQVWCSFVGGADEFDEGGCGEVAIFVRCFACCVVGVGEGGDVLVDGGGEGFVSFGVETACESAHAGCVVEPVGEG